MHAIKDNPALYCHIMIFAIILNRYDIEKETKSTLCHHINILSNPFAPNPVSYMIVPNEIGNPRSNLD